MAKRPEHQRSPDEAELLAHCGEDEVGVLFGDVRTVRLRAAEESLSGEPAVPDRVLRLLLVVPRPLGVGSRVRERRQPVDLVLIQHAGLHRTDREGERQEQQHDQVARSHAGNREHREGHRHQHQRRAEVGLHHDQYQRRPRRCPARPTSRRTVELLRVHRAVAGEHQEQEQLRELARLELERPDVEPSLRALDVDAEPQHRDEHEHGGAVPEQRELAEPCGSRSRRARTSRRARPRSRWPDASRSRTDPRRRPRGGDASRSRSSAGRARTRSSGATEQQRVEVTQRRFLEPRPSVRDDDRHHRPPDRARLGDPATHVNSPSAA